MSGKGRSAGIVGVAITAVAGCSAAATIAAVDMKLTATEYAYPGAYLEPVPGSFAVDSFYGDPAAEPGQPDSFEGTEQFTVYDSSTNQPIGSFDALVTHSLDPGDPNIEVLVTQVTSGTAGQATGDVPNVGSVFNFAWSGSEYDPANVVNTYVDLAGVNGAPDSVYDNGPSALWNLGIVKEFDATSHLDVHNALVHPTDFVLSNGDHVVADPGDPETYSGVTNTSPWAIAVQGQDQLFDVYNSSGDLVGKFTGETISTGDIAGGHSFEILVTGGQTVDGEPATASDLGSGAAQLPTDGSIFNILYYFNPDLSSVYSDYNGTGADGADQISKYWNLFGLHVDTPATFDAVKGFTDGTNLFDSIPLGNGVTITPVGTETYTGINGIPNGGLTGSDTTVQGTQEFTVTDGNTTDSFQADVTTYGDGHGTLSEALYLNPDQFSYGSLPDGLTSGSLVEYTDHGWFQTLEIIPSDDVNLATNGVLDTSADDVTRILDTPLGDFNISSSLAGWVDLFLGADF